MKIKLYQGLSFLLLLVSCLYFFNKIRSHIAPPIPTKKTIQSSQRKSTGNRKIKNFRHAKKIMRKIYADHQETLYCGCSYSGKKITYRNCPYTPRSQTSRAYRVEWEHIVPVARFGKRFSAWKQGDSRCVKKNGKKLHSTQKPEALLHRILLATTNKNDFVFDPFLGSGTTATVAKKLGRNYYGIEKEKTYFNAAEQRLKKTKPIEDDYLDTLQNGRSKPRIPFGSLVELGIIKPGTTIYDNKKKISAKIMADGSIKHEQTEGSIHKVAATILGAESCNGWTFWHYNLNGSIVPIDHLRQRLISSNQVL